MLDLRAEDISTRGLLNYSAADLSDARRSSVADSFAPVTIDATRAQVRAFVLEQGAAISALVTDIDLGGGPTGWDVAHAARERNPGLAVVYATSSIQAEWAVNGVPKRALVTKSFAPTQIVVAVSELLNADA
jgi:DNA-binding NtrC family response regulator